MVMVRHYHFIITLIHLIYQQKFKQVQEFISINKIYPYYKFCSVTDIPPLKRILSRDSSFLGWKKIGKLGTKVLFTFPSSFLGGMVCPLNLEKLDLATTSLTDVFVQDTKGSLTTRK